MSNLVSIPKNGRVSNTQTNHGFPVLSTWFDDLFNNEFPTIFTSNFNTGITLPKVNIKETADAFVVEMAVPGLKKSDFQVDIDNQLLSISTDIKHQNEDTKAHYTRREFGYASFKRTFDLPESVDDSGIKATYESGILTITLPKREEAKQKPARSITIS